MNYLKEETYRKIEAVAKAEAALDFGSRKVYEEKIIELVNKYAQECKNFPKKYTILYKKKENFGTRRYDYIITTTQHKRIDESVKVREADKSIIIEENLNGSETKTVINKGKILCCVW